ncbi:DUF397 domain-containing protein [Embleya sp. AB8]|uniref:DUF397 domain-containing protein n=1 Tax=Embleya sp. AB8 TaxID=3156304 RepID=UPI003C776A34
MNKTKASDEWTTSSYSNNGANCVETRRSASVAMAVRDSKLGEAGSIAGFDQGAWAAFIETVKS